MMLTQYIFVKEPQTLKEAHVEDCLPNTATVLNLHKDVSAFERCKSFDQSLTSRQKRNNQNIKHQIAHIPAVLCVEVWVGLR